MFTDPGGRKIKPIDGGWQFTGSDINLIHSYLTSGGSFSNLTDQLESYGGSFGSGGISNFWSSFSGGDTFGAVNVNKGYLSWWTNAPSTGVAGDIQGLIGHRTAIDQSGFNSFMNNRSASQSGWGNTNPWGVAWATSGVLLADDATVVGVADDVAIVGVLAGALVYDAAYRNYVTYTLTGPNGQKYAGRASGFGDPYSIMMNRFSYHHMKLQGYGNPVLDASAQGYPAVYSAIRGREQQLIDYYGGVGSPNVGNSIRGVARGNPAGYEFWSLSNSYFGNIAPYTGYSIGW